MSKQKIYTLSTAINKYAHVRHLNGCINDADNLAKYIKAAAKAQKRDIIPCTLQNEQATKKNIINSFLNHLGQATEKDICLFYFSGHGGQEAAPAAFVQHEHDNKLEVLACYDSDLKDPSSFLADKELRYLIHQLYQKTKAQIITIFDCCHAGESTRSTGIIRRLMDDAPSRKWEGFIFADFIKEAAVKSTQALETVLPQGQHLHLAACADKEEACEVNGQGVFTSNLLAILRQTKGAISYRDLVSAIGQKIQKSYQQTPQLYARGDKDLIFQSFLGGITQHQKQLVNLVYEPSNKSWTIDMGGIHGIDSNNTLLKIEIIGENQKIIGTATVQTVLPNSTQVIVDTATSMKPQNVYKAQLSGLLLTPISIYCFGQPENVAALTDYFAQTATGTDTILFVDQPQIATYHLQVSEDSYSLQLPFTNLEVAKKIVGRQESSLEQINSYLQKIARWTLVKDRTNPMTTIRPNPPIAMHIYQVTANQTEQELPISDSGEVVFPFTVIPDKESRNYPSGKIRICIKNTSSQSYYCALVYLSQNFGITPDFIDGSTIELLPNKEVWAWGGAQIPIQQEPHIQQYNWDKEVGYLQLIISTTYFDVAQLQQFGLPAPTTPDSYRDITKKDISNRYAVPTQVPDWTNQLIELQMPNPYYRKEGNLD